MERRHFLGLLGAAPFTRFGEAQEPSPAPAGSAARAVLEAALALGSGGGYDSKWGGSGVPEEITHAGERILAKAADGTYCCGFTFAVAMRALAQRGALEGKRAADVRAFQKAWYGATKATAERQCALAVAQLGVGREVDADAARAGDFAQLWRLSKKPSGHSVLFLGWIELEGERVGFNYLSSQQSTDGIGYRAEFFGASKLASGRVDPSRTYFARLDD